MTRGPTVPLMVHSECIMYKYLFIHPAVPHHLSSTAVGVLGGLPYSVICLTMAPACPGTTMVGVAVPDPGGTMVGADPGGTMEGGAGRMTPVMEG
jgi:hypothetical protein